MKPAAAGGSREGNWRVDPAVAGGGVLVRPRLARLLCAPGLGRRAAHPRVLTPRDAPSSPRSPSRIPRRCAWTFPRRRRRSCSRGRPTSGATGSRWTARRGASSSTTIRSCSRAGAGSGGGPACPRCPTARTIRTGFTRWPSAFSPPCPAARSASANLAEAALCAEIEHLARESSRRGGVELPARAPSSLAGAADMTPRPRRRHTLAHRGAPRGGRRGRRSPRSPRRPWWPAFRSASASRSPPRARASSPSRTVAERAGAGSFSCRAMSSRRSSGSAD